MSSPTCSKTVPSVRIERLISILRSASGELPAPVSSQTLRIFCAVALSSPVTAGKGWRGSWDTAKLSSVPLGHHCSSEQGRCVLEAAAAERGTATTAALSRVAACLRQLQQRGARAAALQARYVRAPRTRRSAFSLSFVSGFFSVSTARTSRPPRRCVTRTRTACPQKRPAPGCLKAWPLKALTLMHGAWLKTVRILLQRVEENRSELYPPPERTGNNVRHCQQLLAVPGSTL